MKTLTDIRVRDVLRLAITRFNKADLSYGQGFTNATDEAAYIILNTLSLPIDDINPYLDCRLTEKEISELDRRFDLRINDRMPTAYITGESWLNGYRFRIEKGVIIPRSHLGELILDGFTPWVSNPEKITDILEICTGNGCLAIMLADSFPNAKVDASEIAPTALGLAGQNIADYGLQDRIKLHHADVYEGLPEKKYDLIVTNPPYVNTCSMESLPPEFKHEPGLALAGGIDGMEIVRRILKTAHSKLKKGGYLICEIGNEYQHTIDAFPELEFVWLETSGSDRSVFLLTEEQLEGFNPAK